MLDKDGLPIPIRSFPCDVEYCLIKRTEYNDWVGDANNPTCKEFVRKPKFFLDTNEALEYLGISRSTLLRHSNEIPVASTFMKRNRNTYPNLYADTVLIAYKDAMGHPDFDPKTGKIIEKPLSESEALKKVVADQARMLAELQKKLESSNT